MMRLFLLAAMALPLWGAAYYVDDATGNDTTGNGSLSTPWKTTTKLQEMWATVDGNNTIYLGCNATYAKATPLVYMQGTSAVAPLTITSYAPAGRVCVTAPVISGTLTGESYSGAITSGSSGYIEWRGLTFVGEARVASPGNKFYNCVFRSDLYTTTGADSTEVWDSDFLGMVVGATVPVSAIVHYTGSLQVRNTRIIGTGVNTYGIALNGGTSDFDYCLFSGNGPNVGALFSSATGRTLGANNRYEEIPGFVLPPIGASYFSIIFDMDSPPLAHGISGGYYSAALLAEVTGGSGHASNHVMSWAVARQDDHTAAHITALQNIASAGQELSLHTTSHPYLDAANAFRVQTTNTGATITIDATNLTLHCTSSPNCDADGVFPLATSEYTNLTTWGKGWTFSNAADNSVTGHLKLKSLAALTTTSVTASPLTVSLDTAAYYAAEIADNRAWIKANVASAGCDAACVARAGEVLVYPFGRSNAGVRAYTNGQGIIAGRATETSATDSLHSLAAYTLKARVDTAILPGSALAGDSSGTETAVRRSVRHLLVQATYGGLIAMIYHHGGLTVQQVGWILSEVERFGLRSRGMLDIMESIQASHATADGGITYTKTYIDRTDLSSVTPTNPAHWCSGSTGQSFGSKAFCAQGKAFLGALGMF